MASDQLENFIKVEVSIGYAAGATAIVLTGGEGAELPDPASGEYNLVWWDSTTYPDPADDPLVEVVRVTALATDTLTVTRAQEGTADSAKNTGAVTYKMHLAATDKTITDVDDDERINQASHGLTAGQVVYHNGTIYALADASAAATAESIGIVDDVSADGDYFTLRTGGRMTGLSGLTAGEAHFLSETPGAITATAPSTEDSVIKPILIADSTTSGFIYNMRGIAVTSTTSYYQAFVEANGLTPTFAHNLGHKFVQVQVFNELDQLVMPDNITLDDTNNITVDLTSFGTRSGETWNVVILDSGATDATGVNTAFTSAIAIGAGVAPTITHGLATLYPIVQVYDELDNVIQPDDITADDANNVTIDLTSYGTRGGTYNAVILAGGSITLSTASDLSIAGQTTDDRLVFDGTNWNRKEACAFSAYKGAGDQTNLSIGNQQVTFPTETFDIGGNFASSIFTAPVAGLYQFNVKVDFNNITTTCTSIELILTIGGATNNTLTIHPNDMFSTTTDYGMAFSYISQLAATNTAAVHVSIGVATTIDILGDQNHTTFSGFLIA